MPLGGHEENFFSSFNTYAYGFSLKTVTFSRLYRIIDAVIEIPVATNRICGIAHTLKFKGSR
jgi:hypothetical protein